MTHDDGDWLNDHQGVMVMVDWNAAPFSRSAEEPA